MKVEKIFYYHQVDEFRKFFRVVLSFQEYANSWWKQRKNDVTKLEILNWSELTTCMRRKFVLPFYEKNKKNREKMK